MSRSDPSGAQVQRALHLRRFPAFTDLTPEELAVLADPCEERSFEAGETVSPPGRPAEALHFILEGAIDVRQGERVSRTMHAQEAVGGLAVFTRDPRGVHAVAARRSRTLALGRRDLEEVFEDHPEIRLAVIRAVARTLINVRRRAGPRAGYPEVHADAAPLVPPGTLGPAADGAEGSAARGLIERLLVIHRALGFAGATVSATAHLARGSQVVLGSEAVPLFSVGEPARSFLVLAEGRVRAETDQGQRFELGPGDVVGALDAFAGLRRWYSATPIEPVVALAIPPDVVFDVAEEHPDLGFGLLRALAATVAELHEKGRAEQLA